MANHMKNVAETHEPENYAELSSKKDNAPDISSSCDNNVDYLTYHWTGSDYVLDSNSRHKKEDNRQC